MCGRFNLTDSPEQIALELGLTTELSIKPNYNVAPSQKILAVRQDEDEHNELALFRWGLLPSWIKDLKKSPKPINAKVETVHEKPFFRTAFKKRRCLIPANGFYEWKTVNGQKQPFLIHKKDNSLIYFAGLWENWVSPEGEVIQTAGIITTQAEGVAAKIHDRMPVILSKEIFGNWLDTSNSDTDF